MNTSSTIGRYAPILPLVAGFLLAARQFLLERGVWLDEASLGLNISDRDAWGLLSPLDNGQAAPVLYLQALEAFSHLFGFTLSSLRLPSLLAYGASAWLFLKVMRQTVRNSSAMVLGSALFAFNYMLMYYSGELKQYMGDVFITLLLLHLTLACIRREDGAGRWLALSGALAVFYSNVSVIILATCFAMLATRPKALKDRRSARMLARLALFWSLSAVAYYLLFVKDHPLRGFMTSYWTRAGGFPPTQAFDAAFLGFVKVKLELLRNAKNIFHVAKAGWNAALVVGPIALFAITSLRRDRYHLWILLPIPLHFLMSWARLYPFEIRLTLYILPITILAMTMGLDRLLGWLRLTGPLITLGILSLCLWEGYRFMHRELPIKGHQVKEAARYAMDRARPGQKLWVYPNAAFHVRFYGRTGDLPEAGNVVPSRAQPNDVDACTQEVMSTGSDVWLVFGHLPHKEDAGIRNGLLRNGYAAADSLITYKASAYLFKRPFK